MKDLVFITELVGAVLVPTVSKEEVSTFASDPKSFMKSNFDVNLEMDVNFVENSASEINLALPFYSQVDEISAEALSNEEMTEITGGEILISLFVLGGVGLGAVLGCAAGLTGAALGATMVGVGIAGGLIGATIVGTSVAAGVQSAHGNDIHGNKK